MAVKHLKSAIIITWNPFDLCVDTKRPSMGGWWSKIEVIQAPGTRTS